MDKKYQIFISSTYQDLIEARSKVRDAILCMMHFPVGMKMFGAADEEQWEIIRDTIDGSDYYILIVGQRYGSVIEAGEDAGVSYTEKEFRYAKEKEIPILAFILGDDANIKKADIESDPEKCKKLDMFKADVKTGRVVEWWKTPDELALKVTAALHKQMDRKKRPGWVRGDSFNIEASHAEILELNRIVRNLQEENAKLKSQIVERKPKLTANFILDQFPNKDKQDDTADQKSAEEECCSHGNLVLELNENGIQLKLASVEVENHRNRYEPLDRSCVDTYLHDYVSDTALRQYNDELPSREEIDQYIESLRDFERIYKGGVSFVLQVSNDGTAKATDVRVFVDFPDEFMLFKVSDVADMKEPKAPKLPTNPIEEAEKEYAKRMFPAANAIYQIENSFNAFNLSGLNALSQFQLSSNSSSDPSLYVEEHGIVAEADQIPNKDLDWFKGTYIVPTIKGKFKAKISLMCSEYLEPEEKYIKIEVI